MGRCLCILPGQVSDVQQVYRPRECISVSVPSLLLKVRYTDFSLESIFCHGQAKHGDRVMPAAALYVCILCREANDTCATYT